MSSGLEAVEPYLPQCSGLTLEDFRDEFSTRGMAFNLSRLGPYITDEVFPSLVPGIVLGGLALLGFLLFLAWMFVDCCMSCCTCCCSCCRPKKHAVAAVDAHSSAQFISGGHSQGHPTVSYPGPPLVSRKRQKCTWLTGSNCFWAFFVALTLAAVGVSSWGMAESIKVTDHTVSDFWDLVDLVQSKVTKSINGLKALQEESAELTSQASVLADNQQAVSSALVSVSVSQANADKVAGVLAATPQVLGAAPAGIAVGADFLETELNGTITSIEDDFKPPTMAIQEKWRFVLVAVLFGILIIVVVATAVSVWFMTWPKTAAFMVALLWFCIALLMLIGTGLMRGVNVMTSDACLFAETFALDYVKRQTDGKAYHIPAVSMMRFYLGQGPVEIPQEYTEYPELQPLMAYLPDKAKQPVQDIYVFLQEAGGAVRKLADAAQDARVQARLPPLAATALQKTGVAVGLLADAVDDLTDVARRLSVNDIYYDTKEWLCCSLNDASWDMWVAWTVVGCLSFVLALLSSARIMKASVNARKAFKPGQAVPLGAAALWTAPPGTSPQAERQGLAGVGAKPSTDYEAPKPAQLAVENSAEFAPVRNPDGSLAASDAYARV